MVLLLDAIEPGEVPLPVNVDLTTLDSILLETSCQHLKLGLEPATCSTPVSVELNQRVLARIGELVEIISGQLSGKGTGRHGNIEVRLWHA